MADIGFGVIGAGYMGKAYAIALSQVSTVYEMPDRAIRRVIATSKAAGAQGRAREFGFERGTGDWRDLLAAEDVQAVVDALVMGDGQRHRQGSLAGQLRRLLQFRRDEGQLMLVVPAQLVSLLQGE
mgnify:CR=1 FL=1